MFGDHTIGDAILDRVIHRAHRVELKGPSMRKRHAPEVSTGLTNAKEK
jgi:DNA replication protein DnaC